MNDAWLKFGCFLTGYNYGILRNSSEASVKTQKKFFSAIVIVSFLWGFIGFVFSNRYLHTGILGSSLVALVMVIIVIQIERQIILSPGKHRVAFIFRMVIAVVMAIIGSVIIDQIIFKEDVERQKISKIQEDVNLILPSKTAQLDDEISVLDSLIDKKEKERADLIDEVTRKPFVKGSTSERRSHRLQVTGRDGSKRDTIITKTDLILTDVVNPKAELIPKVDQQITELRQQKAQKQNARITIRQDLENELKAKTGFLEELTILLSILFSHAAALFVWVCMFIFFFCIELFVLANKFGDPENDYERAIHHQMEVRLNMFKKLADKQPEI